MHTLTNCHTNLFFLGISSTPLHYVGTTRKGERKASRCFLYFFFIFFQGSHCLSYTFFFFLLCFPKPFSCMCERTTAESQAPWLKHVRAVDGWWSPNGRGRQPMPIGDWNAGETEAQLRRHVLARRGSQAYSEEIRSGKLRADGSHLEPFSVPEVEQNPKCMVTGMGRDRSLGRLLENNPIQAVLSNCHLFASRSVWLRRSSAFRCRTIGISSIT
jgi:hypothetical protein